MNKITQLLIDSFIRRPSGSLLLVGTTDDGVNEIGHDICALILDEINRFNIIEVDMIDDSGITVEQVRELKLQLNNRVSSERPIARVAIIKHADTATREAQNALLKLVEEPAQQTILLLMASDKQKLLPTIQSRCQTIAILPITRTQAIEAGRIHGLSESESIRLYLLTGGKQKLFYQSVSEPDNLAFEHIAEAKNFLSTTVFNRLTMLKKYDKADSIKALISSIELVSISALHVSTGKTASRWIEILKELRICEELLAHNAQTKLVFMRLSIHL